MLDTQLNAEAARTALPNGRALFVLGLLIVSVLALSTAGAAAPGSVADVDEPGTSPVIAPDGGDHVDGVVGSDPVGLADLDDDNDPNGTTEAAPVDEELRDADGTVEAFVRLEPADPNKVSSADDPVAYLQSHANRTQSDVTAVATTSSSVTVKNRFWIVNAVLVEVDADTDALDRLARADRVERVHPNYQLELIDPVARGEKDRADSKTDRSEPSDRTTKHGDSSQAAGDSRSDDDVTYGLNQINATDVWDTIGTQGDGTKVAVLDTGVDPDHPDIDLYTEDANDPTYPGGFAEFEDDGSRVDGAVARDTDGHGTHVSGTVAGGDSSGTHIGVAPEADLMHGLVVPNGRGTAAATVGGMEWAVEEDADVVTMSLGFSSASPEFIEAFANARAAGTIAVGSAGNSGPGTSSSPGNLYNGPSVGASNESAGIAAFSSGEEIDTDRRWGDDAPEDWPDEYVVPDVAAPGVDVESSVPGGGYSEKSGTSMAAPHVAGTLALMYSANPGLTPERAQTVLEETVTVPDDAPEEEDIRYGHGIVDAYEATSSVAYDSRIDGEVLVDGSPATEAVVRIDDFSIRTDENGTFSVPIAPGTYEVRVSGFGIESTTREVTVEEAETTRFEVDLDPVVDAAVAEDVPQAVQAGDPVEASISVANAESLTVEMNGSYDRANTTLAVDGQERSFGEPVEFDDRDGVVPVTVETAPETDGDFELSVTAGGPGESKTVVTDTVLVPENVARIGVLGTGFTGDVATTLEAELNYTSVYWQIEQVSDIDSYVEYDGFVVQNLREVDDEAFVKATSSKRIGVVYLEQWGNSPSGIQDYAAVTDDPETVERDDFATNPVFYEVERDHPILDGVASQGEQVDIASPAFGEHAWFTGTEHTVLASVGQQDDGVVGPALAVDERNQTVFAGSLGRGPYASDDTYTDEGNQILANAVEHAVRPMTAFEVVDVETDGPINEGERVNVTATVRNFGIESETTTITLDSERGRVAETERTIAANETETVRFTWAPEAADIGVYTLRVGAGYQSVETDVRVVPENGFFISSVSVPTRADPGETLQAEITVTSYVNETTDRTVDHWIGGERRGGKPLALLPGETETITYEFEAPADRTGTTMTFELPSQSVHETLFVDVPDRQMGDADGDGDVSSTDVLDAQREVVGLPTDPRFDERFADVDRDGDIGAVDVIDIQRIIVGLGQPRPTVTDSGEVPEAIAADESTSFDVEITNVGDIGTLDGTVAVLNDTDSRRTWIADAAAIDIAPGEQTTVTLTIDAGLLGLEPGTYELTVNGIDEGSIGPIEVTPAGDND